MQGFTWECRVKECDNTSEPENMNTEPDPEQAGGFMPSMPVTTINTYKDDSAIRDQQSTGRKRAAKMYPLDKNAPCEWAMLKNCGGGKMPITGCRDGMQQSRHHGPDKNTLNNEQGNVHRICHTCHNRWHALNDEGYVWTEIHAKHNPFNATDEDIKFSELFWASNKKKGE